MNPMKRVDRVGESHSLSVAGFELAQRNCNAAKPSARKGIQNTRKIQDESGLGDHNKSMFAKLGLLKASGTPKAETNENPITQER